jgi:hypothetical protein
MPKAHPEVCVVRGVPERGTECVRRFFEPHAPDEQRAEMEQRVRIRRFDRNDPAKACLGLFETARLVQRQSQVVERRQKVRLDLQRAPVAVDRRYTVPRRLLGVAQVLQCFGAARQGT